jgi:dynein heavy chain, axonemal
VEEVQNERSSSADSWSMEFFKG